jgi:hypothetical protein
MTTELAQRENDGVLVRLLWHRQSDRLTVSVFDRRTDDGFELDAEPSNAVDVFNHPYAYAAWRRPQLAAGSAPAYV